MKRKQSLYHNKLLNNSHTALIVCIHRGYDLDSLKPSLYLKGHAIGVPILRVLNLSYVSLSISVMLILCALLSCSKNSTALQSHRVLVTEQKEQNEMNASLEEQDLDQQMPASAQTPNLNDAELPNPYFDQGMHHDLDQTMALEHDSDSSTVDLINTENQCEPWSSTHCERWRHFAEGHQDLAPIMLVHGFFGWGDNHAFDYFYGIPHLLNQQGYRVFTAELDPINSSELRSEQLANQVDEALACICEEKLNIIAHSQGGIDARYLLGPLHRAHLIESLTTISSPHRGFSLADQGARGDEIGLEFIEMLTALSSEFIRGNPERPHDLRATLRSMSIEARRAYDEAWPDPTHVPIYSFAGITNPLADGGEVCEQGERPAPTRGDLIEPTLIASYWMLGGFDTPNDGVVPASSCIWGRFLGCIASDHFDQVGQIFGVSDFDYESFYLNHVQFLQDQGH